LSLNVTVPLGVLVEVVVSDTIALTVICPPTPIEVGLSVIPVDVLSPMLSDTVPELIVWEESPEYAAVIVGDPADVSV
jgi:hypothetical protein